MSYPRREPPPLPAYPDAAPRRSLAPRPPLTKRMRRGHWIALDCVAGGIAAVIQMALVAHGPNPVEVPAVLLLGVAVFVPVALRRLAPVAAFGGLVILGALLAVAGFGPAVVFLAAAYVLYLVTVTTNRQTSAAALGLAVIVEVFITLTVHRVQRDGGAASALFPVALALVLCWITGYSVRQRRLYAQMLQEQATSSAVAEERLRIARELHDVVAHSMSVIAVQAGYGQYVIDSSPSDARDALGAIQATSRDALEEMRRMLGVLRQQDTAAAPVAGVAVPPAAVSGTAAPAASAAPAAADAARGGATDAAPDAPDAPGTSAVPAAGRAATSISAPLAPAPGLARLGRLIERTNGAGVLVSLECSGQVRAVPAGVDLSAYRIIQEALTNVVKHAGGGARCVVSLEYSEEALHIRVTDDGGGSLVLSHASPRAALGLPVAGTGHGIIGMRERANLCGGDFTAGALPGGGFEVTATLPLLGASGAGAVGGGGSGAGAGAGAGAAAGNGGLA